RLAERRGILWSDTNRTIALLRHRRVVDDQHRIFAADQVIGLNEQFRLQWHRIPEAVSDEMVQLVILARGQPRRHWLDALAIARSNQSRDIKRTHPPPRLVRAVPSGAHDTRPGLGRRYPSSPEGLSGGG